MAALRHIALFVPDLQAAETFYRQLFDMALIGREAERDDGLWYALPPDRGWNDALAAGIELGMVALRRGAFVLALFQGDTPPGQVYAIGLSMSAEAALLQSDQAQPKRDLVATMQIVDQCL